MGAYLLRISRSEAATASVALNCLCFTILSSCSPCFIACLAHLRAPVLYPCLYSHASFFTFFLYLLSLPPAYLSRDFCSCVVFLPVLVCSAFIPVLVHTSLPYLLSLVPYVLLVPPFSTPSASLRGTAVDAERHNKWESTIPRARAGSSVCLASVR